MEGHWRKKWLQAVIVLLALNFVWTREKAGTQLYFWDEEGWSCSGQGAGCSHLRAMRGALVGEDEEEHEWYFVSPHAFVRRIQCASAFSFRLSHPEFDSKGGDLVKGFDVIVSSSVSGTAVGLRGIVAPWEAYRDACVVLPGRDETEDQDDATERCAERLTGLGGQEGVVLRKGWLNVHTLEPASDQDVLDVLQMADGVQIRGGFYLGREVTYLDKLWVYGDSTCQWAQDSEARLLAMLEARSGGTEQEHSNNSPIEAESNAEDDANASDMVEDGRGNAHADESCTYDAQHCGRRTSSYEAAEEEEVSAEDDRPDDTEQDRTREATAGSALEECQQLQEEWGVQPCVTWGRANSEWAVQERWAKLNCDAQLGVKCVFNNEEEQRIDARDKEGGPEFAEGKACLDWFRKRGSDKEGGAWAWGPMGMGRGPAEGAEAPDGVPTWVTTEAEMVACALKALRAAKAAGHAGAVRLLGEMVEFGEDGGEIARVHSARSENELGDWGRTSERLYREAAALGDGEAEWALSVLSAEQGLYAEEGGEARTRRVARFLCSVRVGLTAGADSERGGCAGGSRPRWSIGTGRRRLGAKRRCSPWGAAPTKRRAPA